MDLRTDRSLGGFLKRDLPARPSDNILKNVMSESDQRVSCNSNFDVMTIGGC